ncbi:MAG: hypothetical protein IT307_07695 [Chloroflexi bacterium]|nr:hypothetical protein [Chloroflexota bacterium]
MKSWRSKTAAVLGAVLVVSGGAAPFLMQSRQVAAQATSATAAATPTPSAKQQGAGEKRGQRAGQQGFLGHLSTALGISQDKLRDAMFQARLATHADRLAPILGTSADTIVKGLQQGKTIAQIGAENGKSREAIRSAILSARQAHLDRLVQKGRLTADQEKTRLQTLQARIDRLLDRAFQERAPKQTG